MSRGVQLILPRRLLLSCRQGFTDRLEEFSKPFAVGRSNPHCVAVAPGCSGTRTYFRTARVPVRGVVASLAVEGRRTNVARFVTSPDFNTYANLR